MYSVVEAFGVKVIEVPDMHDEACLVTTQAILLVRAGLSPAAREDLIAQALPQCATLGPLHPRSAA